MDITLSDDLVIARLFDVSPFPTVVSRLSDHAVLAVNKATATLFGVAPEDAVGRSVLDHYVHPFGREELAEIVGRDGRVDNVRLQLRREDGSTFWALASSRLVTYGGEPAILTAFNDIGEQLAASERRLAAQSKALTELTERNVDSAGDFDSRLKTILVTAARTLQVERLSLWRCAEDVRSIRCVDLYALTADRHECGNALGYADAPTYFDALVRERVIAAHNAWLDERTRQLRDAYLIPMGIGAMLDVPLRKDNAVMGVLCAEHVGSERVWTVDEQNFAISVANLIVVALIDDERRQAVANFMDSEARARMIIDTAHDAFVGIDSRGLIVDWNAQAEATFGWTAREVLGRRLSEVIIPHEFREAHERGIRHFLASGEAPVVNKRLELSALHRSGREFPIELTVSAPTRVGEGYFFGAFVRDISERRERDEQLRKAKESAEAATRAKSEFLANMSHELRTPLNGVLGYAQLLQLDPGMTPRQREAIEAISKSGSHLLEVINEILDLSKIEAGRVDSETTATDVAQLAGDIRQVMGEAAGRKHLGLRTSIAPDVPRAVCLDKRHLRQVLLNLVGNAIKFTSEGEVRLNIARLDDERLMFEVIDTGVGIEPEALTTIFDAFTQTQTGAAAGGSGLGLTISRHLVRMMGGELGVESVLGSGSRFFFALPLVQSLAGCHSVPDGSEPPLDAQLAPGHHLTAVVADDSTLNRRILAELLENAGVTVFRAAGGIEAIRMARDHHPDVVFMDLRMPDLDGLEATRRLRADPATEHIAVIAVTASALGDTADGARQAGCVDYIPKPVRAQTLFASLQEHLGVRFIARPHVAVASPSSVSAAQRTTIAQRIRNAAAVGDVSAVERVIAELVRDDGESDLAGRIRQLARLFDFDALLLLADQLSHEDIHAGA